MDKVKKYYESSIEDDRLKKDKKHQTEYFITMEYLKKYLKNGMKILEVGAGTGAYSITLAKMGYDVTAVELTDKNVEILKKKSSSIPNISIIQGNAINMPYLKDESFDLVLCFGPLYHLDYQNRIKAMAECKRVCKYDGKMFFAYLSNNFAIMKCFDLFGNYISNSKVLDSDFKLHDDIFHFSDVTEMDNISNSIGIFRKEIVATDGISELVKHHVNSFSDKEFNRWKNYLLKTATNPNQLDYSEHLLYIAKKYKKHIIIAGASRAGKTTLAMKMDNLMYVHYKMDAIKRAMYEMYDKEKKHDWRSVSKVMIKLIEKVIDDNELESKQKEFFVFDTPYLYPDDLKFINRGKVLVIFLGYTDVIPEDKLKDIRTNDSKNSWTAQLSDDEMIREIKCNIEYSRVLEKQCAQNEFAYFDVSHNMVEVLKEVRTFIEEHV